MLGGGLTPLPGLSPYIVGRERGATLWGEEVGPFPYIVHSGMGDVGEADAYVIYFAGPKLLSCNALQVITTVSQRKYVKWG